MTLRFRLTIVRLIFIPLISFIAIILLANGIRELIKPEWINPAWIEIISWGELLLIGILSIWSIYCLVVLYYILTKFVSTKDLEDALNELKKRD
jgi:hypothetical protein